VRALVDQDIFSSIRESIQSFARTISRGNKKILLTSKPTLEGALAIAPVEAALLDSRIPYRRSFSDIAPDSEPFIRISDSNEIVKSGLIGISLSTIIVEGLRGRFGDSRKGPLSTVAQAHALASEINPLSPRLRRMRPWAISGNWINDALDTTYDPVYSSLRDYLSAEGSIRVVPITEVQEFDAKNYFWINPTKIHSASKLWPESDLEGREKIMKELIEPVLFSNSPSTSRIEELLWHCVLGTGWETDLASQISFATLNWEIKKPMKSASLLADSLLSKGQIIRS